jgi:hypothetical protein
MCNLWTAWTVTETKALIDVLSYSLDSDRILLLTGHKFTLAPKVTLFPYNISTGFMQYMKLSVPTQFMTIKISSDKLLDTSLRGVIFKIFGCYVLAPRFSLGVKFP